MAISLRIPADKEELIRKVAQKTGKTKTAVILEAVDAKLGLQKNRKQLIRELAGWMPHTEAEELRDSLQIFNRINEGDWE
ncbi:MAG: ribbon-helix-helix domain-containing protein [Desulfobacterales bacterium]|nr:ribbon-helix-helix domain-containing protein [Desulfobacterales bacterium]